MTAEAEAAGSSGHRAPGLFTNSSSAGDDAALRYNI